MPPPPEEGPPLTGPLRGAQHIVVTEKLPAQAPVELPPEAPSEA
jgi:hypothetical protein